MNLMRKTSAALLSLACVLSLNSSVFAAEKTPVLTGTSTSNVTAKIYDYEPLVVHSYGSAAYGNTIYCSANEKVVADNGILYRLADSAPLEDNSLFSVSFKPTTNVDSIRTIKRAEEVERSTLGAPFSIALRDYYVNDNLMLAFDATYTAKQETTLPVVSTGKEAGKPVSLEVKKGAKILLKYEVNVTADALSITSYDRALHPDWYGDVLFLKDTAFAAGAEDLVLQPNQQADGADIAWENSDIIVAEVNLAGATLSAVPKLTTKWDNSGVLRKQVFGKIYLRGFQGSPVVSGGKAELLFSNPFLTFEDEETISHKDVRIYELSDNNRLTEITKQFSYSTDSDGRGAFSTSTNKLGTYIFSTTPLK